MSYLKIYQREGPQSVEFDAGRITIGRHPSNAVCLDDDHEVSRFHCELVLQDDGEVVLRDLDSRNGTYVGSHRSEDEQVTEIAIELGTVFRVGSTRMRLTDDELAPDQWAGVDMSGDELFNALASDDAAALEESFSEATEEATQASAGERAAQGRSRVGGRKGGRDDKRSEKQKDKRGGGKRGWFGFGRRKQAALQPDEEDGVPEPGSVQVLAHVGRDVGYGPEQVALINARGDTVHPAGEAEDKAEKAETANLARLMLLACIRAKASDVHVEPREGEAHVRLRVDGAMVQACKLDEEQARRLMSLIKVLGDLDITRKSVVQESHFSAESPDRRIDYRVSFTPSMYGQKLVLRVLDPMNAPRQLSDLALPQPVSQRMHQLAGQDTGMLLVAGPTGSGKTTTLYAMLRQIDAEQRNVITIEDPIEYALPGATQIPVDEKEGHTFASLLRSVLRQDPDVIMVGEIRDAETAKIAMQAATTGHLVLSTIHAQDTMGAVFRLHDLEVESYVIGSTLNIVLAQRLARRLCPHCRQARTPSDEEAQRLSANGQGIERIYDAVGCHRCFETGFSGRQGIFEMLHNTESVRDVIQTRPSARELRDALAGTAFAPLRDAGLTLVRHGTTCMSEIDRVIGQ